MFSVTREKKIDLAKKQSSRNVYQCHVIGPMGAGKSSFCRSFIRSPTQVRIIDFFVCVFPNLFFTNQQKAPHLENTGTPTCTVNVVQVYGQEKIMVLRDINVRNVSDPLLPHEVQCDVACLVYDTNNAKSFEYIARIYIVSVIGCLFLLLLLRFV